MAIVEDPPSSAPTSRCARCQVRGVILQPSFRDVRPSEAMNFIVGFLLAFTSVTYWRTASSTLALPTMKLRTNRKRLTGRYPEHIVEYQYLTAAADAGANPDARNR